MTLPTPLTNYPHPNLARTFDPEFERMRYGMQMTEGVENGSALTVTTGNSGLNVSVAAGKFLVDGDERSTQGQYFCFASAATTVTLEAADGSNPRIDRIIGVVSDADVSGSATEYEISYVKGTAHASAALATYATYAPVEPDSAITLGYVLVPAGFAGPFVNATHILSVIGLHRALAEPQTNTFAAGMYLANSGSPTHTDAAAYQKVGSGGGTATYLSLFDVSPAGFGTQSNTASKRIDIVMGGLYRVTCAVYFSGLTDLKFMFACFAVNGTHVATGHKSMNSGGQANRATVSELVDLEAGDYVELGALQNQGTTTAYITSGGAAFRIFITVDRVGPSA